MKTKNITPDIDVNLTDLPPTVRRLAISLQYLHYPVDHIVAKDEDYSAAMSLLAYLGYTEDTKLIVIRGLPGNGRVYDGSWYIADGDIIGPGGLDGEGLYAGHSQDFWEAPPSTRYERKDISMAWSGLAGLYPAAAMEPGQEYLCSTPYEDETPRQWVAARREGAHVPAI